MTTQETALYDRMVDALGPEVAAETIRTTLDYAREHTGCSLPGGAQIIEDDDGLRIVLQHDPLCPALTEGTTQ